MSSRSFLLVVMFVQVLLLSAGIGSQSLWLDEVMSLNAASAAWPEMRDFFAYLPEQHPLYYLVLRAWLVFGESETALRSLSAVMAAVSTPALYFLTRRLADEATARTAAALNALSPFLLYYGQETRMYTMLALLAILGSHAFVRWRQDGAKRHMWWYIAFCILGSYTHFFFLFLLLAHLVSVGTFSLRSKRWPEMREVLCAQLVVGAAYLPWMVLLAFNLRAGQTWKGVETVIFGVPYTFMRFSVGYAVMLANSGWKSNLQELVLRDAVVLLPAALVIGTLVVVGSREALTRGWAGRFAISGLFVPMAAALIASSVVILVGDRYFIVCFPFFLILLSYGAVRMHRTASRTVFVSVIAIYGGITATSLGAYHLRPEFGRGEWRDIVNTIETLRELNEIVIVSPNEALGPIEYYRARLGTLPAAYLTETALHTAMSDGAFWLVLSGPQAAASVLDSVMATHQMSYQRHFSKASGVSVFRFSRPMSGGRSRF